MLCYIDPGTGSMLFTLLIGIISAAVYKLKDIGIKAKFTLSGNRSRYAENKNTSYVIFSDHKRYWNVFEPICDEFERREVEIAYLTASADDPALDKQYNHVRCEFIGEGNKAYATLNTLHADIVLSTTPSLDVLYWKRSKYVKYYVHIPHAASDLTMYRMFGIDFYDAILTSGDYHETQIRSLEKVRGLPPKEIVKTGLTFMDTMKKRLEDSTQESHEGITVLLAPSWGKSAIFSKYGSQIIEELLKTSYKIIIRPHPQSFTSEKDILESLMARFPESDRIEWNRDNDNFDVLTRSDIMISDFSGVMFDFSLVFDKPLIYTDVQYDTAPYDACWLDEEPWTFRILPDMGIKLTEDNMADIGSLIEFCINDDKFKQGREKAREETWANIGVGAEKIADYLIKKHDQILESVDNEKQQRKRK